MKFVSLPIFAATALAQATPSNVMKRSPAPELVNGKYVVGRQAEFDNSAVYTFENGMPDGLFPSDWPSGPNISYPASNVRFADGYMDLWVPGGQTQHPYNCAEVNTRVDNILYASVRTVAILSEPEGVCNGMFFYAGNTQETDIEWLSDPDSQSNGGTRKLFFTNQDANGDGQKTYTTIDPPADATSAEHEYRIDWTEGRVQWFVDGAQVFEATTDVPSTPGPWLWNNWADGDYRWSVGPPEVDTVFKIKKIEMYYNTA